MTWESFRLWIRSYTLAFKFSIWLCLWAWTWSGCDCECDCECESSEFRSPGLIFRAIQKDQTVNGFYVCPAWCVVSYGVILWDVQEHEKVIWFRNELPMSMCVNQSQIVQITEGTDKKENIVYLNCYNEPQTFNQRYICYRLCGALSHSMCTLVSFWEIF